MSEDLSGKKIPFSSPSDWDLIKIIAQFLSKDPRLSIKELVDNALDAFSRIPYSPSEGKLVKLIIRKKDKVNPHIKIVDNGPGWDPHKDSSDPNYGRPDFEYTVQNIGESIKKKFAEFNKAREEGLAVGRYGIGMFSFWAVAERLTAYSRSVLEGKVGPCSMMVWLKDDKEAIIKHDVDPPSELSEKAGSVLVLDHLTKAQMNLVTGNILADYLSRASRTLLMKSGANLIVDDHGKSIPVIPKKYVGTKFPMTKCETKGFGSIDLEIYAFPHVQSDEEFRVPLFVKAAKAYDDITELPELNKYPWNAKKVYGEINYPFGTLSPSRTGLVNDLFLGAFIETMHDITTQLAQFVDRLEAKKKAKQRDKFYTVFREKWEEIFKQLPEEWLKKDEEIKPPPPPPPPPPPKAGPMYRVEISPNEPKVSFRTVQSMTARPYDMNGNILRDSDSSLIYSWKSIGKPLGIIKDDMSKTCHFQVGSKEGIATIKVTVLQYVEGKEEPIVKTAATNIFVVSVLPPRPPPPPPKGDKPPTPLEDNLGEDGPHSKYDPDTKIVTINDHHKDWIKAEQKDIETLYRYFNYCFAKEVAVDRWKFLDPHELSEKITDLVALSERSFNWKELIKRRRGRHPKEK
jgi:hypothetical protein